MPIFKDNRTYIQIPVFHSCVFRQRYPDNNQFPEMLQQVLIYKILQSGIKCHTSTMSQQVDWRRMSEQTIGALFFWGEELPPKAAEWTSINSKKDKEGCGKTTPLKIYADIPLKAEHLKDMSFIYTLQIIFISFTSARPLSHQNLCKTSIELSFSVRSVWVLRSHFYKDQKETKKYITILSR